MKKTVAAIIVTTLLALGLFASPVAAEEPAPVPDCDQTVQEWKDRALAAEAEADRLDIDLYFARGAITELQARIATLDARNAWTERQLEAAENQLVREQKRFYRQFNRITRQRLTILRLRERLQATR